MLHSLSMAMASTTSSATVAVDKATSDLLITPDWTMNMDICDSVNSNHWQAKDVVKAVKKRLQHKNPRVQFLALTLLETMVKNCGDFVHFQIAERNILGEMVKIVKKKTDMQVRDKVLVLLDSWQEAFGGPGGKYPQYYWAYEDLRRSGVQFPPRALNAAPIFTPPLAHSTLRHAEPGYGMPGGSSRRLDETMATEIEGLSLSSLESMLDVMELLGDMLQAVGPNDREAVKGEVIVDLVEHCRSNQKKLVQMLTTTGDEEILVRGLELNDTLQILLAKHDAIASGLPIPVLASDSSSNQTGGSSSNTKPTEVKNSPPTPNIKPIAVTANPSKSRPDEDDEEEDDFAKLARRHSKSQSSPSQASSEASGALVSIDSSSQTSSPSASSFPATSTALAIVDPVKKSPEQDIIDLLSITLSTDFTSPQPTTTSTPTVSMPEQSVPQIPVTTYASQAYPGSQAPSPFDSYVVPWAQPQSELLQVPSAPQPQPQFQSQPQFQPQLQPQQFQSQQQYHHYPQYPQYSSTYPPPPWAATPGYYTNGSSHNYVAANNTFSNNATSFTNRTAAAGQPMHQNYGNSSSNGTNGTATNGDTLVGFGAKQPAAQKPFVPSYRLFEDLNVLGNGDGKFKVTGSAAPSLSGSSGQSMVGGRK